MFGMSMIGTLVEGGEVYSTLATTIEYFEADLSLNQSQLQASLEERQLKEFKAVLEKERSRYVFRNYKRGETDPPDFFVTRKEESVALELTVITNEQRASVASKLAMIKDYFKSQFQAGKLQSIKGLGLTLELNGNIPRKLTKDFEAKLLNVVQFLDGLHVPSNFMAEFAKYSNKPGAPYPMEEVFTSDNIIIRVVSFSEVPITKFQYQVGFDLEIHYQLDYKFEDIQRLLDEKVARKDIVENQELLIVVGGPNQRGIGNPDEASAMKYFLSKNLIKLEQPKYLQRIYILLWPYSKHYLFDFNRQQKFYRFEKKRRR